MSLKGKNRGLQYGADGHRSGEASSARRTWNGHKALRNPAWKIRAAGYGADAGQAFCAAVLEEKLQGDIAYFRVPAFDAGMTKQIREKLAEFERQGAKKLILDLRDCPTGEDQEGISTAQLFVPSGTITTLKGQTVTPVTSSADASKVAWSQPVSVLVGIGTAGPAEIVASAIADNHRGDTVGDRTYGAASMQKLIEMDDGAALILTVANYFTPEDKEIPANGVTANSEVHPAPDDSTAANDQNQPVLGNRFSGRPSR